MTAHPLLCRSACSELMGQAAVHQSVSSAAHCYLVRLVLRMTATKVQCRAAAFAFGLATTLALLGVVSSAVGKAYGQIGEGLPVGEHPGCLRERQVSCWACNLCTATTWCTASNLACMQSQVGPPVALPACYRLDALFAAPKWPPHRHTAPLLI